MKGGSMHLYRNKSINPALRIPLNRGNKLFSRFSVMLPLTNGEHYNTLVILRRTGHDVPIDEKRLGKLLPQVF